MCVFQFSFPERLNSTEPWPRCTLHVPPMLVDKTNFSLAFYNHANFYRFEETSSYWSIKRILIFLCFSLVNQRHTSGITVYNRTVTDIGNTVRAVHRCNSWFFLYMRYIVFLSAIKCLFIVFLSPVLGIYHGNKFVKSKYVIFLASKMK